MNIEKDNFIVKSDKEISYLDEVITYLDNNIKRVMDFFELENISNKKNIIIWCDITKYKEHCEEFTDYKTWMCGDTFDGNINMLEIEECHKTEDHDDMTLKEFKENIVHEFVHICQQEKEVEPMDEDISWFWEALATNLGNPYDEVISFDITSDELNNFNDLDNNYEIAYTIGKYMLDNYDKEKILEYVMYPKKLVNDTDNILKDVRSTFIRK